jgi:hypothetical protein
MAQAARIAQISKIRNRLTLSASLTISISKPKASVILVTPGTGITLTRAKEECPLRVASAPDQFCDFNQINHFREPLI